MKLYCSGLELSEAVLRVSKAMPIKKTMSILEGIKLSAIGSTLTITATDLELAIERKIRADIKLEGEVVVPGKFFCEFIKKLTNEEIEISTHDNKMSLKYGDSVGELQCLNLDEFPPIRKVEEDTFFTISQRKFMKLIDRTIFSVSTEDLRPILKGCLIEIDSNLHNVRAVALDGFRLAVCEEEILSTGKDISVIIPARSLAEISRIIEDEDIPCTVYIQNNYLMLDLDHTKITSRLIEGDFIQYKKIIPREFNTIVTVNKSQMETGLERASLVSRGDKNNLIKLDIKEKNMSITSNSELGNINENVVISLNGKDISIAFNVRYFTEAFRVIDDEFIQLNMSSSTAPCIIKPMEGEKYLYMILPVKMLG